MENIEKQNRILDLVAHRVCGGIFAALGIGTWVGAVAYGYTHNVQPSIIAMVLFFCAGTAFVILGGLSTSVFLEIKRLKEDIQEIKSNSA